MKKRTKALTILMAIIVLMSGCTKTLSDDNKKRIVNEVTGQALTSNILCLPEDEELLKIYEKNKKNMDVDYDSLRTCSKFKPSNLKYNGLWETLFIKPLAYIMIKLGLLVNNYGLALIILGILIRMILFPFTKKTQMQSENMKKAQPELQAIQKKYGNTQDQAAAMQMSQEMMLVYKKYGINPAGGCLVSFIQLPILLAFLEAINRVPAIFEGTFLTLQLGTSPFVGIKNGNYWYIILLALIILTTYFSYKYSMSQTKSGNPEQDKQMDMMMKFMIIFISVASLSLPTALALYWIVSNGCMIAQTLLIKKLKSKDKKENKKKKDKKEKVKNAKIAKTNRKK